MMTRQVLEAVRNPARLEILGQMGLLDTQAEPAFDRLTRLASRIVGVPVALISLVDEDRQFFKSQVGLVEPWSSARETPLTHSFCKHVVFTGSPLIVSDARRDPLLKDNLAVAELGVVAYAGVPLTTSQGCVLGAFCGIDGKARDWAEEEVETLEDLAAAVMTEIELRVEVVQRRKAEHQARGALRAADSANRAKTDFLTSMSHELRTPLNSIIGFSNLLMKNQESNLTAQQSTFLERIGSNGTHLLGLINEVLDLARVESGVLQLETSSVCLARLVDEVLGDMQGQIRGKPLRLVADVPPLLAPLETDAGKLKQVLINLVGNAIKFTAEGTVTVRVTADRADGPPRSIQVIDTGIGVATDCLAAIFEPFRQADPSTSRRYGGTGLGLALCRSLLTEMGCSLDVESTVGQGSTFTIELGPSRGEADEPARLVAAHA